MSELSTVAIKDGHRGHLSHHHHSGFNQPSSGMSNLSNQLDAERADRISRLAGLERVTTARNPTPHNLTPGAAAPPAQGGHSYFDSTGNPAMGRERSTVGSASATGSVGARTTWAGSEAGDRDMDKMSESQNADDVDMDSVGPSEEQEDTGSLVAFGEGARTPARQSVISVPGGGAGAKTPRDAKMIDGMTYDSNVVDTTAAEASRRHNFTSPSGAEQAERIVRDHMDMTSNDRMRGGNAHLGDLGKFGFEK
ncbi:hypothetical protein BAUCODRAFT_119765 [Baudoinia panamericana UAMH 10762]|uniref:Uncharacterized protein n=1 Tax=Baudoinia panamericana (strain UAMH 10762) TaxID=717646 RepID=M2N7X6_BAUPA|nr:uncharacterized protein BAUCODRAFT_119765 [Baudoinia panamericana UAMH 10762]EMD00214.1 hypothetical protein BAUCODRAFT_119765 [Baudoinia panamericana UAMH 10762]